MKEILAKATIREVLDKYAIASDAKNLEAYAGIFSSDIQLTVYMEGKLAFQLQGLDAMVDGLRPMLASLKTQYHFNGQSLIKVDKDKATSTTYNRTFHVTEENGQVFLTKYSIRWEDKFIRLDGEWYIQERTSYTEILEKTTYQS